MNCKQQNIHWYTPQKSEHTPVHTLEHTGTHLRTYTGTHLRTHWYTPQNTLVHTSEHTLVHTSITVYTCSVCASVFCCMQFIISTNISNGIDREATVKLYLHCDKATSTDNRVVIINVKPFINHIPYRMKVF